MSWIDERIEPITVTARYEIWEAVMRSLKRSPESNPFYHALVLEIESALSDRLDEAFERCA